LFKKLYLVFRIAYLTYLHKFTNGEVRQLEVDYWNELSDWPSRAYSI